MIGLEPSWISAQVPDPAAMEVLAMKLAKGLTNRDPKEYNEAFSLPLFEQRIKAYVRSKLDLETTHSDVYQTFENDFFTGFNQELSVNPIGTQLVKNYEFNGSKLAYLRFLPDKEMPCGVLRVAENQMVDYLELYFALDEQGNLRIVDSLSHASGLMLSKIMGNVFISAFQSTQGLVNQLLDKEKVFLEGLETLNEITRAAQKGDVAGASILIDKVKPPVKDLEVFMVQALATKARISDQSFLDLVDYYQNLFPNHPALRTYGIIAETLRGNYKEALVAMDKMEQSVGGDPFMNILRAAVWMESKDYDLAEKAYNSALVVPHAEESVYWGLVSLGLLRENYDETVTYLKKLEMLLDVDFALDKLVASDPYKDFGKSKEFAKWKEEKEGLE